MSTVTIKKIQSWKNKRRFSAITAYDFSTAQIINETNIPLVIAHLWLPMGMIQRSLFQWMKFY